MKQEELTPLQERFVREYVADGCKNQTQAAIAAGYKPRTAASQASRLLKKVNIQRAVEEARAAVREKAAIDAAWVVEQIASIAKDEDQRTQDRLKALEMLAKHLGLFEKKEDEDANEIRVEIVGAEGWLV